MPLGIPRAAPTGSLPDAWYPVSGRWFSPAYGLGSSVSLTGGTMYVQPLSLLARATFDKVNAYFSTVVAKTLRIGLYASDSSGQPASLIGEWGNFTISVADSTWTLPSPAVVNAGAYWLAMAVQGAATGSPGIYSVQGYHSNILPPSGTSLVNSVTLNAYTYTGITGALPTTLGAVASVTHAPRLLLSTL